MSQIWEKSEKVWFWANLGQFSPISGRNIFFSKIRKRLFSRLILGWHDGENQKKLMPGSMRTFVTDRPDGQTTEWVGRWWNGRFAMSPSSYILSSNSKKKIRKLEMILNEKIPPKIQKSKYPDESDKQHINFYIYWFPWFLSYICLYIWTLLYEFSEGNTFWSRWF